VSPKGDPPGFVQVLDEQRTGGPIARAWPRPRRCSSTRPDRRT
jgi:hypothetical protein